MTRHGAIYDGFGNLITDYQSVTHVNTSTSPKVQYVYDFANNHDRLVKLIYPGGRVLYYGYDNSSLDDAVSRNDYLADDTGGGSVGTHLVDYSYLGLSTVVIENHPEDGVALTYVKQSGDTLAGNDGGDQYSGLDRFGRVVDQNWINTSTGSAVSREQYGYDRDGNVLYRNNLGPGTNAASFSQLYHANSSSSSDNNSAYDSLNRLTGFRQGALSSSGNNGTSLDTVGTSTASQSWNLDSQGNWSSQTVNGTTTSRTTDQQNELTSVGSTTLTYDNNGNTLTDDQGNTYIYDAWNRVRHVSNTSPGSSEYYIYLPGYDVAEQISFGGGGPTEALVYSDQGQVLWQKDVTTGNPITEYVWGITYVNDLILRDRDADANATTGTFGGGTNTTGLEERLYAIRDANHDVTAIVDTTGTVKERFVYTPYGQSAVYTATWTAGSDSYNWLVRFQGGRMDAVSGTYGFHDRVYSTTLGRWLQQDPAGYIDSPNLYGFTGDNPVSRLDPSGMSAISIVINVASWGATYAFPESKAFQLIVQAAAAANTGHSFWQVLSGNLSSGVYGGASSIGGGAFQSDVADMSGLGALAGAQGMAGLDVVAQEGTRARARLGVFGQAQESCPPNLSPLGAGRRGAFREAKRRNGVPVTQHPDRVYPSTDRYGNATGGRTYEFDVSDGSGGKKTVTIREDPPHHYPDNPNQDRGPHFNDDEGGHYDFPASE